MFIMNEDYYGMTKEEWLSHSVEWMQGYRLAKEENATPKSYYNCCSEEWQKGYDDGHGLLR